MKRFVPIVLIAVALAMLIGGCSSGDTEYNPGRLSPSSTGSPGGGVTGGSGAGGNNQAADQGTPDSAGNEGEGAVPLPLLPPSISGGKRIVYTVDVQIQTTAFMSGIRTLLTAVGNMEGYVESANVQGRDMRTPDTERSANYTLRMYSERLSDFLVILEDNYNLVSLRQTSTDVSANYRHGDSTLDDLRDQEARLLRDLENTRLDAEDRLEFEQRLAQVQSSIRSYERQQYTLNDDVLYSTVNVQLREVIFIEDAEEEEAEEIPELTFGERLSVAVERAIDGFVAFCQGFLIVLIRFLPILIILIILAIIAYLVYRVVRLLIERYRKKNLSHKNTTQWYSPPPSGAVQQGQQPPGPAPQVPEPPQAPDDDKSL